MNGVEEVVISRDVVDGDAKPLLIYADREKLCQGEGLART